MMCIGDMWASWVMVCSEWGKVGGWNTLRKWEGAPQRRRRLPPCPTHALKKQRPESEASVPEVVHLANAADDDDVNREIIGILAQ
jgi:hypothetical protein